MNNEWLFFFNETLLWNKDKYTNNKENKNYIKSYISFLRPYVPKHKICHKFKYIH